MLATVELCMLSVTLLCTWFLFASLFWNVSQVSSGKSKDYSCYRIPFLVSLRPSFGTTCPSYRFYCCDKHHDRRHLGEESVCFCPLLAQPALLPHRTTCPGGTTHSGLSPPPHQSINQEMCSADLPAGTLI